MKTIILIIMGLITILTVLILSGFHIYITFGAAHFFTVIGLMIWSITFLILLIKVDKIK